MSTKDKPTTQELIDSYTKYRQLVDSGDEYNSDSLWHKLCDKNERALYTSTVENYNQENFKTLIDSIEFNGITNFNMTTFIGNIDNWLSDDQWNATPVNEFRLTSTHSCDSSNAFNNQTTAFNCNSVGCIAGFAVANAVSWVQPSWLKGDSRNYLGFFEQISCNWLNIPLEVGRRIFYGEPSSVWSFVRFHEPANYGSIQWVNLDNDHDYETYEWEDFSEDNEVLLETINYKYAADVLRRIASGEIVFNKFDDFAPSYSK